MVAALVGRAQHPADSVSVVLKHLKDTNAELVRVNENLKTHAAMVAIGGAAELVGFAMMASSANVPAEAQPGRIRKGALICGAGAILTAASFIPFSRKGVQLDGRGFVVHPSELRRK